MRVFVVAIVVILLATPLASASFDWWTLVTESLVQTDLWQTEEWYWATPDNMRCGGGWCVYEANPLYAGRDMEHIRAGMRAAESMIDLLPEPLPVFFWAFQIWNVTNNNEFLASSGLGPRWMIAYRWTW